MDTTVEELQKFEQEIAQLFEKKEIRAPVHLESGSEQQLIDVFNKFQIGENDWVCGSWRFHLKALLKGMPPEELRQQILAGRSISLESAKYKIITSAIVGGIFPIAVGLALALKLKGETYKVYCWSGDMSSETGTFYECLKYTTNFDLPLVFIIENNKKSVGTPTLEAWGRESLVFENLNNKHLHYYEYENSWPHVGVGKVVEF